MNNAGMFKVGTKFIWNVNGVEMEILTAPTNKLVGFLGLISVRMGNPSAKCRNERMVQIKEVNTGKISYYGLSALYHCDVTILN